MNTDIKSLNSRIEKLEKILKKERDKNRGIKKLEKELKTEIEKNKGIKLLHKKSIDESNPNFNECIYLLHECNKKNKQLIKDCKEKEYENILDEDSGTSGGIDIEEEDSKNEFNIFQKK